GGGLIGAAEPEFGRVGPERFDGQLGVKDGEQLARARGSPGDGDHEPLARDLWLTKGQFDLLTDAGGRSAEPDTRQIATRTNRLRDRRRQPAFRRLEQLTPNTVRRLVDVHVVPYVHAHSFARRRSRAKGRRALRPTPRPAGHGAALGHRMLLALRSTSRLRQGRSALSQGPS